MADRAPPQRWRVEERGGKLIVIDTLTGAPPPTAAERHGAGTAHMATAHTPTPTPTPERKPVPVQTSARSSIQAQLAAVSRAPSAMPWANNEARPKARPSTAPIAPTHGDRLQEAARTAPRASPVRDTLQSQQAPATRREAPAGAATTMTTQRWFDAKGPRTIMLTRAAQDRQQKMLMWLILALVFFAVSAFLISPVILFVAAFVLLRGGRDVLAQAGAKWIDSLENAAP
ncbi:MAG: hypothetical protein RLZZ58_1885 [Pseudomonadota bacterium]